MPRAILIVLDSVGCGGAPDAAEYGDEGANTLAHIDAAIGLRLPNLAAHGLGAAIVAASGARTSLAAPSQGAWGYATEVSQGKDTPSGHWELAGVPVPWDWHYFPDADPAFDPASIRALTDAAGAAPLGLCHASGTDIIARHGAEHVATGRPIVYTSADSVVQIAAHEGAFGLDRLLALCEAVAPHFHAMKVGRVIARPFVGTDGAFARTGNRRDYAIPPPAPTLCDWVRGPVHAVGKIGDIFSGRGIDTVDKGTDAELMDHLTARIADGEDGALIFANFVEFDSLYGHRRDPEGYARHLEWFDARLPDLLARLRAGDLMAITADHGNDPTWRGTDHTRERVPVLLMAGPDTPAPRGALPPMHFADVAATLADHLGLTPPGPGRSVS
ncbi:MAG: phosphopentomutase [Shimia sp.]